MVAGGQSAAQQFARAAIGHTQQHVLARLPRGLSDAEHPKIAVPDKQALGQGIENDPASQDLLTDMERTDGAIQGGPAQSAEAHDHPHQAPIRAPVLVAMGGELLGHAPVGSQTHGAAVQQSQNQAVPEGGRTQADDLTALQG
jgi:hypothetical protein